MTSRRREMLRAVMRVLAAADGEPMEIPFLQIKIEGQFVPRPTKLEVEGALKFAEDAGLVRGTTGTADEQVWAITNKGRLAEV